MKHQRKFMRNYLSPAKNNMEIAKFRISHTKISRIPDIVKNILKWFVVVYAATGRSDLS